MNRAIIWMVMFFVALVYEIVSNWLWYENSKKLNSDWYKLAMKNNEEWAELCKKIEAERDALREKVAELKAERNEE